MSSDETGEHGDCIDVSGNPATVERVFVVDPADGATTTYAGDFSFRRDGGSFEVTVPVGTAPVVVGDPSDDAAPTVHASAFLDEPPALDCPAGTEPIVQGDPIESGPLTDRPIETVSGDEGPLTEDAPEHVLVVPLATMVASGRVTAVELLDERVVIAVDDPMWADPAEVLA